MKRSHMMSLVPNNNTTIDDNKEAESDSKNYIRQERAEQDRE